MGFKIKVTGFNEILSKLRSSYRVLAPVNLEGKGVFSGTDLVTYGEIEGIEDVVFDRKTTYPAKEAVFPPAETLFYFTEEGFKEPQIDNKGLLIFARACDINAFKRLDAIYLGNGPYPDHYYRRLREKVKFVLMECNKGFNNCFCVSMGANKTGDYSLLVRPESDSVSCLVNDPGLESFFSGCTEKVDLEPQFVQENKVKVQVPENLDNSLFDHPLWEEYTSRCIGCGRCNLSCPTCTCFTMQDIFYRDNSRCGERRRVWASCMIDGFTEMAGGHGYRNKQGDRMRFKVMHKFSDFNKCFGFHMCVGCGRCDDVCPEYISLPGCVEKLSSAVGGER